MIYFDNAATEIMCDKYLDEYFKYSKQYFANSSSIHQLGLYSSRFLNEARNLILSSFSLNNHQVIFTSGSTEAINLALKGFALSHKNRGMHIISDVGEHAAVLESLRQLEDNFGFDVTLLPLNEKGTINLNDLKKAIRKNTVLVAIMAVNNETGAINDINGVVNYIKQFPKVCLYVDATQAVGKIHLPYQAIDMFSYSAHKIGGLKGSGALIFNKKISFMPILSGGGHEFSYRSGTVDVALAYVLGEA